MLVLVELLKNRQQKAETVVVMFGKTQTWIIKASNCNGNCLIMACTQGFCYMRLTQKWRKDVLFINLKKNHYLTLFKSAIWLLNLEVDIENVNFVTMLDETFLYLKQSWRNVQVNVTSHYHTESNYMENSWDSSENKISARFIYVLWNWASSIKSKNNKYFACQMLCY